MAIQSNFPNIKPSLLLDFANVEQLDPRITFARASTARYYDGKTTTKAEENLLLQSQTFETTWIDTGSTVSANSVAAPDGTTTADTLAENTTTSGHIVSQAFPIISGSTYSASVFGKNVDGQYIFITFRGAASNYVYALFDLLNGVVTTSSATGTGYSVTSTAIQDVGGGWYRCSVVGVIGTTVSSPLIYVGLSDASAPTTSGFPSYTGTSKSIEVWGAQLEQRSAVTAYTPTTDQPITNYVPTLLTAQNNVARFDHNPTTGESLGLLIEESRTNLVTYSEDFADADWMKTRSSITANTLVAPDGTLTGDKFVIDTTASNNHSVSSAFVSITNGTTYTWSVFAKASQFTQINLRFNSQFPSGNTFFDLSAGTVSNLGTVAASSITPVGNGWYRCTLTQTANATGSAQAQIFLAQADTITLATGDGYSGVYIWGAQLEAGAFPTSYIPTDAAQVTRSADAASMTGTNFSSWYRQDEGTLYSDASTPFAVPATHFMQVMNINNGTTSNVIRIGFNTESVSSAGSTTNNVVQVDMNPSSLTGVRKRVTAFAYSVNNFAASTNGVTALTDTSGILPVVSQMNIGVQSTGSSISTLSGHIRKIAYYPLRVTDAQLQALTS